jgi:hypothetical protein
VNTGPFEAAVRGWRAFWFRPTRAYPLGLVRIAFGALIFLWTATLYPGLADFFGPAGISPAPSRNPLNWSIFHYAGSDRAVFIAWLVLLLASVALTVGWHSRIAALVVFVLVISFQVRTPAVFNSGDVVVRLEALFLALAPCGAALSLDQRRRTGAFWSAQVRAPWVIRLMQIQLSIIYLFSVRTKMSGTAWPEGTAVSYAMRLDDMVMVPPPGMLITHPLVVNVATWGVIALETSLAVLVWVPRLRPWVLAAGVVMHTVIAMTINVGFFSPAMFVLYLAFASPTAIRDLPQFLSRRLPRPMIVAIGRSPRVPRSHCASCDTSPSSEKSSTTDAPPSGCSSPSPRCPPPSSSSNTTSTSSSSRETPAKSP